MANQEQHNGNQPEEVAKQPAFAGAARRRFATRGAAAVGVALTLKSTPGMAAGRFLPGLSPSGAVSGNVSRHVAGTTLGYSPGYYKNHSSNWPSQNPLSKCAPTSPFTAVFVGTGGFATVTMIGICAPQQYDTNKVAMHIMAAYLNAKLGLTPYLPYQQVKAIWEAYWFNGGPGRGYYIPPGTDVRWDGCTIVEYLKSTMHPDSSVPGCGS